ncbi:MAG: PKD domain-containing protein [Thermoproteota archaeon]|nr:PKD domain-containing protein [Thermoproteota archaeon]
MTIAVISTIVVVAIILLAPNTITITNAQQLPPLNSQPTVAQNRTTLFQSAEDGVRLNVPEGWVIHDVNNTGSMLSEESTQGYAILAQLCPQEEEQEQTALSNINGTGNTTASCRGSEGEVIHIVRYPDLDTRLFANNVTTTNNTMTTTTDNILTYHLQQLQEVGYRSMQIVNSTDITLNVRNAQTNQTIAAVPAQFVEMIYNTASAPNETREGYFILTATNATQPNVGMTKGYSIFYEGGNSSSATTSQTTTPSGNLVLRPLAPPVREVFDSFELVAVVVPTEQPLTVELTSNDTEAIAPATFEFEADITGGIEPYTISWNFDDGSSEESDDDVDVVNHTFEESGSYDVNVTVTDSRRQSASDSTEITVEEEEEAPPAEEDVEEEPIPIPPPPPPPPAEEDEEEPIPSPPPADDVAEDIEDEVDAFVQELLDRFGVEDPGLP